MTHMLNSEITNKPGEDKGQGKGRFAGRYSQVMMLGTNLAVAMALFALLGYYADYKRGGGIFWTMCGTGLGLAYGGYEIWKTVSLLSSEDEHDKHCSTRDPDRE